MGNNENQSLDRLTAINLAAQVKSMRDAQKQYFLYKGKAAKTKSPDDFKLAANFLNLSKAHEKLVDASVIMVLTPVGEEVGV
jgi:hypothetical protein